MAISDSVTRREFLKGAAIAGAAVAASGTLLTAPAAAAGVPDKWDTEADVVIVGAGGAGVCAAIGATDKGAKVLVIEKATEAFAGGNTRVSGGGFRIPAAADAKTVDRYNGLGFGTTPANMAADVVKMLASVPDIFKQWGINFVNRLPGDEYNMYNFAPGPDNMKWGAGREVYAALKGVAQNRKVQIMYETPATNLIQDPSTREILGVVAQSAGKKINIRAKRGVIMACGGFEANAEMMGYFILPGIKIYPWGSPYNTGDGIGMVSEVGAALWHMNNMEWATLCFKAASEQFGVSIAISDGGTMPFLLINKYGKRFMAEDKNLPHNKSHMEFTDFDNTKGEYTNMPCYYVFDETWRLKGPVGWHPTATMTGGAPFLWNGIHKVYEWSNDNSVEIGKGWIVKGDTLDDLAKKLSVDPKVLAETVTKYNGYCSNGVDPDFGKQKTSLQPLAKPPYYAAEMAPSEINTQGGPKHDSQSRVLDKDNNPIPRLFSAGEFGSFFGFVYPGGSNLAEAISFGKLAGENAAALSPKA